MKKFTMTLMVGAATLALSTPVAAQSTMGQSEAQIQPSAGNVNATTDTRISEMNDEQLVVLTGTVASIDDDEFILNYGGNQNITVELDRFGFDGDETEYLTIGESVTVSGYIDDDLFEGREIEALDVRLNDSYVYYYYDTPALTQGNMNADNDMQANNTNTEEMSDGSYASLTGSVTEINGDMATVSTNNGMTIEVDLSELGYDATDDEGMQKIELGDRLYVYGEMDEGFFNNRQLVADGVVEMRQRGNMATGSRNNTTNNPTM
jgi:uncharacterized protein YdeI (BOF family)